MRYRTLERLEKALAQCAAEGMTLLVMEGLIYLVPTEVYGSGDLERPDGGMNDEHPDLVRLDVEISADGGAW